MLINYVEKRNGKVVEFQKDKINKAVLKAGKSVNTKHPRLIAVDITKKVVDHLEVEYNDNDKENCPNVEEIQNLVENYLMKEGHFKIAKAYIIYREKHSKIRNTKNAFEDALTSMKGYLDQMDWRVNENSNMSYSLQGLNNFIVDEITSEHWLQNIYSDEIEKAHKSGNLHIHDLGLLSIYCVGWDLKDLLLQGFRGVPTKTESKPPKHLKTAFGQVVNFFYSLQGEAAGAQALSNFDTYLAPFIAYDNLSYKEVKQAMQEFIFNINVPTRVGFQSPFTNITMDLKVPKHMQNEFVIIGGEYQDRQFGEFQKEMDMLNKAFAEVMMAGDAKGRMFPFPIPTYSVTEDFDWDNETLDPVWEMTAKYGIPYWNNFINSDMDPEDTRSMCCRLNLDNKELRKRGGGLFGANPLTGSVGVVTLNLPRIAFQSENEKEFMERIYELMDIAKDSLEVKRKVLEKLTDQGLYPYSKFYLRDIKKRFDEYWSNHFSTIGLVGMNEALLNLFGVTIADKEGNEFAEKVLSKMKERLLEYQKETDNLYNLEATPAEGTSYSLAKKDRERFGNEIICANQERVVAGEGEPYYTNSTQLPVGLTEDVFEALDLQDNLQSSYTGGSSFHAFIGEKLDDIETTKKLVKRIAENYKLPYYSITPTFSICPVHGYIPGEHEYCPKCKAEVEAEEAQEKYNTEKELTSVNTSDLQPLDI
jgi:ribonucleoside-triphosphate reductase